MMHAVINHLWQSTAFALLAWLLTLAFRRNRAQVRYWLWFSASVKFLVPFALLLSLGGYLSRSPVAKSLTVPAIPYAVVQVAEPFPVHAPVAPPAQTPIDWLPIVLVSLWMCGFLSVALSRVRGWLRIRAALHSSKPLGISFPVPVRSTTHLLEPGVIGFFRPKLLLPTGIKGCLTPEQLHVVLTHELCHVRRRDNLMAAIHMVVEAVFWFHPLVWWLGGRLVEERERACDEAVLESGSEPQVYAESILKICQLCVESPLACAPGVTGADLKRRIEAIMANRIGYRLNRAKKLLLASVGAAAVAGPIFMGVSYAPAVRAQAPTAQPAAAMTFEVASIKPSRADGRGGGLNLYPARIRIVNSSLKFCVETAWNLQDFQVSGAKGWIATDRYDIEAVAAGPFQKGEYRTMLRALLVDRFGLAIHRDTQNKNGFALVVGRGGPKLPPPTQDPDIMFSRTPSGDRALKAKSATLKQLAEALSSTLGAPVVDRTGIEGQFNVSLEWAPDPESRPRTLKSGWPVPPPPADAIPGPSLFTALQQTLGLKLEKQKVPVEVMVIDHASRPTPN
ncbi:MAG TPA: M56 family metallopeptidase [Terriglobia bacterium]|nr:M56 family metallopeptidase [Terriglobia bacterium]